MPADTGATTADATALTAGEEMTTRRDDQHICAAQAVCFRCFKAGMDRVRARREAWAQRSLPFDQATKPLTRRAVAHREQMLAHLASLTRRA
jgi:hypothetical protein